MDVSDTIKGTLCQSWEDMVSHLGAIPNVSQCFSFQSIPMTSCGREDIKKKGSHDFPLFFLSRERVQLSDALPEGMG